MLEFCDCGTLRDSLSQRAFLTVTGKINYRAVLDTAADVAKGMAQLHSLNIVHADLKVGGHRRALCTTEKCPVMLSGRPHVHVAASLAHSAPAHTLWSCRDGDANWSVVNL